RTPTFCAATGREVRQRRTVKAHRLSSIRRNDGVYILQIVPRPQPFRSGNRCCVALCWSRLSCSSRSGPTAVMKEAVMNGHRSVASVLGPAIGLLLLLSNDVPVGAQRATASGPAAAPQNEWLTWGYDQERTLWNRAEKVLSKDNVGQLTLKWKTQIPTPASLVVLQTLTTPLVVGVGLPQGPATRVFLAGSDNTVYAVDAETGAISWQRKFPHEGKPKDLLTGKDVVPDYRCPGTQNATPVIDKDSATIYVST